MEYPFTTRLKLFPIFSRLLPQILKAHVISLSDIRSLKSSVKRNKEITVLVIALEKEYLDNNNAIDILVLLRNQKGLGAMAQFQLRMIR